MCTSIGLNQNWLAFCVIGNLVSSRLPKRTGMVKGGWRPARRGEQGRDPHSRYGQSCGYLQCTGSMSLGGRACSQQSSGKQWWGTGSKLDAHEPYGAPPGAGPARNEVKAVGAGHE